MLDWTYNDEGLRQRKNVLKVNSSESIWKDDASDTETTLVEDSVSSSFDSESESIELPSESFFAFRLQYLIVHIAIMLADGMQGKPPRLNILVTARLMSLTKI